MYLSRKQTFKGNEGQSFFFWGPRQTGKSTLLTNIYPDALWFDLLKHDLYQRLLSNPEYMRETVTAQQKTCVVVDEIQRIPALLNEIHWLIVNHGIQFILSGSSPRKILRSGENLLGGRTLRYELFPLVSCEIPDFDLLRGLNHGMLPTHYMSENPRRRLSAYIGSYLKDEIVAEAKLRRVDVFARFLEAAAFSNAEVLNYSNIAADCGVSQPTIKEYFQILEDTLIGRLVPPYQKKPKRRVIKAPKFYFFDVGITNQLLKRGKIEWGTELIGNAFESFIFQELLAHSQYSELEYPISYWRTASQLEVDFILGQNQVAIEVKSAHRISSRHLAGLNAFMDEYQVEKAIVVCTEPLPRLVGKIEILPWQVFLERLWNEEII
jgi:predicted AAA+ superfamily ATPase